MRSLLGIFLTLFSLVALAEPAISIRSGSQEKVYTRTMLMKMPGAMTLVIAKDPAYPDKATTYLVVPVKPLFDGVKIPKDATIQFHALDGFSAPIAASLLFNTASDGAKAYLAIERPGEKWPAMKPGVNEVTPAPFYLVWVNPEKSGVVTEQWVTQLSGFTIEPPFDILYPHVAPGKALPANDPVMQGFRVFKANCFSCHTMNREGNGKIGPDLNVPYNPTEYMHEKYLRLYIRNPQNLRHFPQDKMIPFPESTITNADLDNLIAYLQYMKNHKQ